MDLPDLSADAPAMEVQDSGLADLLDELSQMESFPDNPEASALADELIASCTDSLLDSSTTSVECATEATISQSSKHVKTVITGNLNKVHIETAVQRKRTMPQRPNADPALRKRLRENSEPQAIVSEALIQERIQAAKDAEKAKLHSTLQAKKQRVTDQINATRQLAIEQAQKKRKEALEAAQNSQQAGPSDPSAVGSKIELKVSVTPKAIEKALLAAKGKKSKEPYVKPISKTPKVVSAARQMGIRVFRNTDESTPLYFCFKCNRSVRQRMGVHHKIHLAGTKECDTDRLTVVNQGLYQKGARGPIHEDWLVKSILEANTPEKAKLLAGELGRNIGFEMSKKEAECIRILPKDFCDKTYTEDVDSVARRQVESHQILEELSHEVTDLEGDLVVSDSD